MGKPFFLFLLMTVLLCSSCKKENQANAQIKLISFVDPFIGTGGHLSHQQVHSNGKKEWKSVNARLRGPSKTLFGKSVTPLLEKHSYGFTLWAESPFTNTTLAIDEDGKFENFEK